MTVNTNVNSMFYRTPVKCFTHDLCWMSSVSSRVITRLPCLPISRHESCVSVFINNNTYVHKPGLNLVNYARSGQGCLWTST